MPQLDFFSFQNIVLYTILVFIGISFYFFNTILPKIYGTLKTRKLLREILHKTTKDGATIIADTSISLNPLNKAIDMQKQQIIIKLNEKH